MGVRTSEFGYTSATTGRGDHEVHKGHVVALYIFKKVGNLWDPQNINEVLCIAFLLCFYILYKLA
jgi:hypothetical protein